MTAPVDVGATKSLAADRFEKSLAAGSLILLVAVLAALARGSAHWREVPGVIWAHLGTIILGLALTPVLLLRRRGNRTHRVLGAIWLTAMFATAGLSLGIRTTGHFSAIHILSVFTIGVVPFIWWSARNHRIAQHRLSVRMLIAGALLLAGLFTFPFHRLLGTWLFD